MSRPRDAAVATWDAWTSSRLAVLDERRLLRSLRPVDPFDAHLAASSDSLALAAPVPEGVTLSKGRLASGSIFLDGTLKKAMKTTHWDLLDAPEAAEMENAGVAQICKAYSTPYLSLRALSDVLEGDANEDFGKFCQQAADNVFPIVKHVVANMPPPA